ARRRQMRDAATVFDPGEQQRLPACKQGGARVENTICDIGPVRNRQNRILGLALKEFSKTSLDHPLVSVAKQKQEPYGKRRITPRRSGPPSKAAGLNQPIPLL